VDTTPPTVSLQGGATRDGTVSVPFGTEYRELGAEAWDRSDGDLSKFVMITDGDQVDVWRSQEYRVTYRVRDRYNNVAEVQRPVMVQPFSLTNSTPLVRLVLSFNVTQSSPLLLEAVLSSALGDAFVFIVTFRDHSDEEKDFNLLSRFDGRRRRNDLPQNSTYVVDFAARDYATLDWMAASDILSAISNPGVEGAFLEAGVTLISATETKGVSSAPVKGGGGTPAAGAAGAAVFVLVVIAVLLFRRRHKASRARAVFKSDVVDMLALDRSRIRLGSQLGFFGDSCLLRDAWVVQSPGGGEEVYLALEAGTDFSAFQRQAELRAVVGDNRNILGLCGQCASSVPQLLLFERVSVGNLRDQLRRWRDEGSEGGGTLQQIKALCAGVTAGVGHLHEAGVALGHVCAANIALDDRLMPKLSSFHYARRTTPDAANGVSLSALVEHQLYGRWLAPETLKGTENGATIASDIWSLGVTVWEICTLAATPYFRLQETKDVLASLSRKKRLKFPLWATHEGAGELSILCWRTLAEMRGNVQQVGDVVRRFPSDGVLATDDLPPVAPWDGVLASAAEGAIAASEARPRLRTGARQRTATAVSITRGAADWMRFNPTYAASDQSADSLPAIYGVLIPPKEVPTLPGEYFNANVARSEGATGDALYAAVEREAASNADATSSLSSVSGYSSLGPDHEVYRRSEGAVAPLGWRGVDCGPPGYTALEPDHMLYRPVALASGPVRSRAFNPGDETLSEDNSYI
jgi:serine/threonine protein kinase